MQPGHSAGEAPVNPQSDEEMFADYGAALARAVEAALPGWVAGSVRRHRPGPWDDDLAGQVQDAGQRAASSVGRQLAALLALDVDEQWTNPLTLIRGAVTYPTEVLHSLGAEEPIRDDHDRRFYPDDHFGLNPAAFADLGPEVHDLGLQWGAAKAHLHLRRRRGEQVG